MKVPAGYEVVFHDSYGGFLAQATSPASATVVGDVPSCGGVTIFDSSRTSLLTVLAVEPPETIDLLAPPRPPEQTFHISLPPLPPGADHYWIHTGASAENIYAQEATISIPQTSVWPDGRLGLMVFASAPFELSSPLTYSWLDGITVSEASQGITMPDWRTDLGTRHLSITGVPAGYQIDRAGLATVANSEFYSGISTIVGVPGDAEVDPSFTNAGDHHILGMNVFTADYKNRLFFDRIYPAGTAPITVGADAFLPVITGKEVSTDAGRPTVTFQTEPAVGNNDLVEVTMYLGQSSWRVVAPPDRRVVQLPEIPSSLSQVAAGDVAATVGLIATSEAASYADVRRHFAAGVIGPRAPFDDDYELRSSVRFR